MDFELHIALVQSQPKWESPRENRDMFEEKIRSLSPNVDVVVLPEMFTTGFTMNPQNIHASEAGKTIEWMGEMAKKRGAALMGSIVFTENGQNYNRLFFVDATGGLRYYDKKHTFTLAGEDKVYKAGAAKLILEYRGFKICPMICYDLRFPVWARNTEGYDVLIYVANWPKPRITAWDTLLKARAIENMAYCVGVNRVGTDGLGHEYSGHSAVYDVLGEQMAFSNKEEILYATLYKEHIVSTRQKLRFLEDKDRFKIF